MGRPRRGRAARHDARGARYRSRSARSLGSALRLGCRDLVLILVGAVVILAAVSSNDPGTGGEILGFGVSTLEAFFVGVAAGALILWGFSLLKWGTKRTLAHRRERKELNELNEKLERVEAERREDDPERRDPA